MALTQVSRGLLSTSIVDNGNATAITIDSSENVGIGTSSPVNNTNKTTLGLQGAWGGQLDIMVGSTVHAQIGSDNFSSGQSCRIQSQDGIVFKAGGSIERMRIAASGAATVTANTTSDWALAVSNGTNSNAFGLYVNAPSTSGIPLRVDGGGSERMRIDSSGNLLVNRTSVFTTAKMEIQSDAGDASTLALNSINTDGSILEFYKAGSTVGSIGTVAGRLGIGTGDSGLFFDDDNNKISPVTMASGTPVDSDGLLDLGYSAARFRDFYRSGSTISTSDRNMKQDIRDLTDAERNVAVAAKGLLKAFRFIDRVEEEGDSANIHFGIIAQDLAAAFTAEGLDANDYQVYRADTFTDDDGNEQTRLGICYENLLAFIISAI